MFLYNCLTKFPKQYTSALLSDKLKLKFMIFILLLTFAISFSYADVVELTNNNFKMVLDSNELVLVDFYASWCYFSNILDPIFTDASNILDREYKDKSKVVLGKVDCEKQTELSREYGIRKYPTIKLFRFGKISKREYRGARSGQAFVEYIKQQLTDPIIYVNHTESFQKEIGKSYIVGYFHERSGTNFDLFRKVAHQINDECNFVAKITPDLKIEKYIYETTEEKFIELEEISNIDKVKEWVVKLCTPVVRNITFQNAEDITEEGLPLVLLFYNPSNPDITVRYTKFVTDHLLSYKKSVNFVYADGQKFAHPLVHLGKSEQDLPLIAIDSFQHMFLLPTDIEHIFKNPEIMIKYITDLHSGKLHREFHNGPDPEINSQIKPGQKVESENLRNQDSTPIPSVFKKLKPNSNRYTLFHDEF